MSRVSSCHMRPDDGILFQASLALLEQVFAKIGIRGLSAAGDGQGQPDDAPASRVGGGGGNDAVGIFAAKPGDHYSRAECLCFEGHRCAIAALPRRGRKFEDSLDAEFAATACHNMEVWFV